MEEKQNKHPLGVLGLGEVMLRLSPPGKERISHSECFEKNAGGSELNVVSGISMLGIPSGIITKIPQSEIGKYVKQKIRYFGANTDYVITDDCPGARLGVYYYEKGAYPRPSIVSYDREYTSFSRLDTMELPNDMYKRAKIFHTSGITLGLDKKTREIAAMLMKKFSKENTLISFDVNYREALWNENEAKKEIEAIFPLVDILFISEETSRRMFKMIGTLEAIHKSFAKKYPNLKYLASTRRKTTTPNKQSFSSLVYNCQNGEFYEEEPYDDIDVIDRVGSGDAYVAGALYALLKFQSIEKIAQYGNAMAAMKITVSGDVTKCDLTDIERIIRRHKNSNRNSEMVR